MGLIPCTLHHLCTLNDVPTSCRSCEGAGFCSLLHNGGVQVGVRQHALAQLLDASASAPPTAVNSTEWLDAEGSSLIRTLGKVWGGNAPYELSRLLERLVLRHFNSMSGSGAGSAASETCSLAVAFILPALLKYALHS